MSEYDDSECIVAECIGCGGRFVCSIFIHEYDPVFDLRYTDLKCYETVCHECSLNLRHKDLWIDANGLYIINQVYTEEIEGR